MLKPTQNIFLFCLLALPVLAHAATVQPNTAPTKQVTTTSQPAKAIAVTTATSPSAQQTLKQQVNGLLTAAQNSQQQLQTRISQLNQQNSNLQQQLALLQKQFQRISQGVKTQPTTDLSSAISLSHNFLSWQNPLINSHLAVGMLALGFLLLMWLLWYRVPAVKMTAAQEAVEDDEYDFMGSEEALPAKLALARAYMEMGNAEEARSALAAVVAKGDKEQRDEAMQLLKELPVK